MFKKLFFLGCALGASFFIGCSQSANDEEAADKIKNSEPDLYEASELALLMRNMYAENLELKQQIENGDIPQSFPQDFYKVHTAASTKGMIKDTTTYHALADEYIKHLESITKAPDIKEAKIAYNYMISTCASCHQIYCQGPLKKIQRMKISEIDAQGNN